MALLEMDEAHSKWRVVFQFVPTFGVTWSLIRVVVSCFAYGFSQHSVCPQAP